MPPCASSGTSRARWTLASRTTAARRGRTSCMDTQTVTGEATRTPSGPRAATSSCSMAEPSRGQASDKVLSLCQQQRQSWSARRPQLRKPSTCRTSSPRLASSKTPPQSSRTTSLHQDCREPHHKPTHEAHRHSILLCPRQGSRHREHGSRLLDRAATERFRTYVRRASSCEKVECERLSHGRGGVLCCVVCSATMWLSEEGKE
jgi:hypothetical protein